MPKIRVLINGAGSGRLCLAHTLRKAHIDIEVFERDAHPGNGRQGYRLHLEADALNALREVLAVDLHQLFEATAMRTEPFTTMSKTDLSVAKRVASDDGQDAQWWPEFVLDEKIHCNVDGGILRGSALPGLEDCYHFNKPLTSYKFMGEGVLADFADDTTAIRFPKRPDLAAKESCAQRRLKRVRITWSASLVGDMNSFHKASLNSAVLPPKDLQAVAAKMLEGWPESLC